MTQYQQHELSRIDGEIAELEKKIAVKHEQRRELVNRMGLNKQPTLRDAPYLDGDSSGVDMVNVGMIDMSLDMTSLGSKDCQHKNSTCVDVTAMSDDKTKLACHCDDCGCQLPWQHTELKP